MTRWFTRLTTAVVMAITSCGAIASAQTQSAQSTSSSARNSGNSSSATQPPDPQAQPTQTAQAQPATQPSQQPTAQVVPVAPQKNRLDRFADRLDITAIPAGAIWMRDGRTLRQPGFQSYVPGGALGIKLNSLLTIEGEGAFAISTRQALDAEGIDEGVFHTPTLFGYTGSVLVTPFADQGRWVPYGVAGLGGMFVARREDVGQDRGENLFIGNFGGGVKVMFGKWGVRGDYRFLTIRGQHDVGDETFIGDRTRFANRIYAGLVIAPGRQTVPGS